MCGIVGIISDAKNVGLDGFMSLSNLQHRGQSGAGMVFQRGENNTIRIAGQGEITDAFRGHDIKSIPGNLVIGQCRYPTTGTVIEENVQPIHGEFRGHTFHIVHNGNIVNLTDLIKQVGCNLPEGCSDTYILARLISQSIKTTMEEALIEAVKKLRGSFNLIVQYRGRLYVVKDRFGFHPLQLGQSESAIVVASESCAFNTIEAEMVRDIMPGEILVIEPNGNVTVELWTSDGRLRVDIFEYIYFCRPDSFIHGVSVSRARKEMGRRLWQCHRLGGDTIGGIPDSGIQAAFGYYLECQKAGIPIEFLLNGDGIMRPHVANRRTFIINSSDPKVKEMLVRLKYQAIRDYLNGMITLWGEDSVVRGDTLRRTAKIIKAAGAKAIHFLISSPMYLFRELYGIDTYRKGESLLAWEHGCDLDRMARAVGVDSINYLALADTIIAILEAATVGSPLTPDSFHAAPFNGIYVDGQGDYALAA